MMMMMLSLHPPIWHLDPPHELRHHHHRHRPWSHSFALVWMMIALEKFLKPV
jgi:hypothetical protein